MLVIFRRHLVKVFLPLLLISTLPAVARVRLPYFFSDNMVLQQSTKASIWGWARPGSIIQVTGSWNKKQYNCTTDASGNWKTKIETPIAGGPYELKISDGEPVLIKNVLIGEVWLCSGQSNMEMPMKGYRDQPIIGSNEAILNSDNDKIRLYIIPRAPSNIKKDTSKRSDWKIASPEAVSNFSATAYFFGRLLQEKLKVPIGLVNISYGGTPVEAWMPAEDLKEFKHVTLPKLDTSKANPKTATVLYNGMIHPFTGYGIKGAIFYQGESNYTNPDPYEFLLPAMVASWRRIFDQGDFPFYYAQIAPYKNPQPNATTVPEKNNSAYLRDAQRKALDRIPGSGMVVLMDIGEETNIHPANKEIGAKRLAYMALAQTYGKKGFGYASPLFDSLLINGSTATIKFKNTPNGLTSFGKPITNFEMAGADKVFHPAKAVIFRGTIQVTSPNVPQPVAVRYAFKDFIVGELFNTEGFPVSSFRTDNW